MTAQKTFSSDEVKSRNGKGSNDCWIIYKGNVYDVTKYLDDHPGGPDLVLEWGGKDCTKAFNDAGHSAEAFRDLKLYKIGKVMETSQSREILYNQEAVSKDNLIDTGKKKKSSFKFLLCR